MEVFGAGEVAHDQRDAVIAGIDPGDDALRIRNREAEPVHAGVDMNGRTAGPARAPAKHVPFGELIEVVDDRPGVDPGERVAGILEEAAQHIDCRRWQTARAARASSSVATKKVLQPAPASARAIGSTPQP